MDAGPGKSRPRWVRGEVRRSAAVLCLVVLAGCDAPSAPLEEGPSRTPLACSDVDLAVSMSGGNVRAVNIGAEPCALRGTYPVGVPWWRINGPAAEPATGTLRPGDALVQTFKAEGGNGCPGGGIPGVKARLGISVEGRLHTVTLPARDVYEITTCDVVSAPPPKIEPAVHTVG